MNVAPSAIATALAQAEATFGMALVTCARAKGIFPTAADREMQRRIDGLLERYETLLTDVAELRAGVSGTLNDGYNAPIGPAFLPTIAARLLQEHPDVTLSFSEGDSTSVRAGLIDGQFDLILFVEEVPNPQIATRPLIFALTYCLCSADHPLARQSEVFIGDIVREPLIFLDRPAVRSYYAELLNQASAPLRIIATANSTEMLPLLVAEGLGV